MFILPFVYTISSHLLRQSGYRLAEVTASLLCRGLTQPPIQSLELGVIAELLDDN